jgi:hypothetical protein
MNVLATEVARATKALTTAAIAIAAIAISAPGSAMGASL